MVVNCIIVNLYVLVEWLNNDNILCIDVDMIIIGIILFEVMMGIDK